ncbi:MAG: sigma-70 family RNA polymerase sigma factor [Firmicutes bacterium]|nr:sigma-70 family RNA polymerase sigma factor [Bacillota bacterium]
MQLSEEDTRRIEEMFDSFCKTVLRNFARDWCRMKKRRGKIEILFSELSDGHVFEIQNDFLHQIEQYSFDDLEESVKIESYELAEALRKLSKRQRQIILLSYFFGLTDQQIGERFHVVRSTIQSARSKALKELRGLLEEQNKA